MNKNNYIILKQAVAPEICDLIAEYARLQASVKPKIHKRGDPLAYIHRAYADPLMETLLLRLTPKVEEALQCELWPTLSFYYTYAKGNELNKHKDRSSCEFVAGLYIAADPQFTQNEGSWPLCLDLEGKEEKIALNSGDLVIFKGHEVLHWREKFTGQWCVSAIFGYVDKNGPFAFQKFDQRKSIGLPHIGMLRWSFGCLINKLRR
ncbi:MAG: hypothetical protein A3F18_01870 [Legionellales bacterium RIFCSPHIGHO2_12_FULL_37_14]|nr:MAG: hypothetical protein A3F18_01870 [Legionellales bacterium RIFCSPHIGHO2_12_FULL_37_14]